MEPITVSVTVDATVDEVWQKWNEPTHIERWAFASDDWECPKATNDLREGGRFVTTMAAKDGSVSFDFAGTYEVVVPNERIEYVMDDGRRAVVTFSVQDGATTVTETFDPEGENPVEMQRAGWQAILENFKKHVEA